MSDSQSKWTFEHSIYILRRYTKRFFMQDTPSKINKIKRDVSRISYALEAPKNETMIEILLAGIASLNQQIEAGKKGKFPEPGSSNYQDWIIDKKCQEIYDQQMMFAKLEPIYKELGPIEFKKWCKTIEMDPEGFLKYYSWQSDFIPQSERDKDWIREFLQSNGGEAKTPEIREAALVDEVIVDSTGWQRLEKNAERIGILKDTGKWRL